MMSGHSHWAGIKHKKEITDAKRGKTFSKLLKAISIAARTEPNPDFNPRLRTAVMKAKEAQVPLDNIERAIARASQSAEALEELLYEAYGPGGAGMMIEVVTDNRNRSTAEIKKMLADHEAKWATPGSVQWSFEQTDGEWRTKFPQELSPDDTQKLAQLIDALENHDDVQRVITTAALP
jgi:YebC/PmpR family DNA-binding regulatory protein